MMPNWPASASPRSSMRCASGRSPRSRRATTANMPGRWPMKSSTFARRGALRISHLLHLRAEICSETLIDELAEVRPRRRRRHRQPDGPHARPAPVPRPVPAARLCHGQARLCPTAEFRRTSRHAAGACATGSARRTRPPRSPAARRYGAVLASHDDTDRRAGRRLGRPRRAFRRISRPRSRRRGPAATTGITVMMGAPNLIRGGSHSGNVAAGAGRGGPARHRLVRLCARRRCCSAALLLGDLWGDIAARSRTVTQAPADAAGLNDRGRLAAGRAGRRDPRGAGRRVPRALRGTWVRASAWPEVGWPGRRKAKSAPCRGPSAAPGAVCPPVSRPRATTAASRRRPGSDRPQVRPHILPVFADPVAQMMAEDLRPHSAQHWRRRCPAHRVVLATIANVGSVIEKMVGDKGFEPLTSSM